MSERGKVFCVGMQRTGTTSLGAAMELLGYRVCGAVGGWLPEIARRAPALASELVPRYDAFQDNPWPLLFRELDGGWPDARFVLTIRDSERWCRSMRRYFTGRQAPIEEWIYGPGGVPAMTDAGLGAVFARHNTAVRAHFARRADKLLVLNLDAGGLGWERLCSFLGLAVPNEEFPRLNDQAMRAAPVPLATEQPPGL